MQNIHNFGRKMQFMSVDIFSVNSAKFYKKYGHSSIYVFSKASQEIFVQFLH